MITHLYRIIYYYSINYIISYLFVVSIVGKRVLLQNYSGTRVPERDRVSRGIPVEFEVVEDSGSFHNKFQLFEVLSNRYQNISRWPLFFLNNLK